MNKNASFISAEFSGFLLHESVIGFSALVESQSLAPSLLSATYKARFLIPQRGSCQVYSSRPSFSSMLCFCIAYTEVIMDLSFMNWALLGIMKCSHTHNLLFLHMVHTNKHTHVLFHTHFPHILQTHIFFHANSYKHALPQTHFTHTTPRSTVL